MKKYLSLNWSKTIFALLLIFFNIVVSLPIPLLSPVFGIIFLTFFPGFLIVNLLRLKSIDFTELIVLSVGLSLSFILIFGIFFNNILSYFGYINPLSKDLLIYSFNVIFFSMILLLPTTNKLSFNKLPLCLKFKYFEKIYLIPLFVFPTLSFIGANCINEEVGRIIFTLLLLSIGLYIILFCSLQKEMSEKMYSITLFSIGFSLVLMIALKSKYIIGIDTHLEYYLYQNILNNARWSALSKESLDSCLSITLLPVIYQRILGLNSEIFFNIFYVFIFSFVPLIIFIISKKYVGIYYGYLSAVYFIFQNRFIFSVGGARTNIAIFFFGLTVMTLTSQKIEIVPKKLLAIIFSFSVILSHYSTSIGMLFILVISTICLKFYKFYFKNKIDNEISTNFLLLVFSLLFLWYSLITVGTFEQIIRFIDWIYTNLNLFFVQTSRAEEVSSVLGRGILEKGISQIIEFILTWIQFVLIAIGITTLLRKLKDASFTELFEKKTDVVDKFDAAYTFISTTSVLVLFLSVAIPLFSKGYGILRIYTQVGIILSVIFVLGCTSVAKALSCLFQNHLHINVKIKPYVLILLILIPYFLSVSGLTYQLCGYPRSPALNSDKDGSFLIFMNDYEMYSCKWIDNHISKNTAIQSDFFGGARLISHSSHPFDNINRLSSSSNIELSDGYFYLDYYNTNSKELLDNNLITYTIDGLTSNCSLISKLYDNNGSSLIYIDSMPEK